MLKANRDITFDIIRIVAISLVVLMHSPMPNQGTPGVVLSGITFLCAPGVGLFFMISGALLLNNKLGQKEFIKRRFSKIIYPTLLWQFVYIAIGNVNPNPSTIYDIYRLLVMPFSVKPGNSIMWFMYVLMGLYLLTPILSRWLQFATRKEVRFYLLIWGTTLLFPYLSLCFNINTDTSGLLYYFSGYVGYFVLGYYLKRWVTPNEVTKGVMIGSCVTISLCVALVGLVKLRVPNMGLDLFWYLSFPVAAMTTAYFLLLTRTRVRRCQRIITKLSSLSFGLYLIHMVVMRSFLWDIPFVANSGAILHIPFVAVLTMVISWALVWMLSKLSFSKYIIGI